MIYSIMVQQIAGDNSVYVSISENNEAITFSTLEDAQARLVELQASETEGREYTIKGYPEDPNSIPV